MDKTENGRRALLTKEIEAKRAFQATPELHCLCQIVLLSAKWIHDLQIVSQGKIWFHRMLHSEKHCSAVVGWEC